MKVLHLNISLDIQFMSKFNYNIKYLNFFI